MTEDSRDKKTRPLSEKLAQFLSLVPKLTNEEWEAREAELARQRGIEKQALDRQARSLWRTTLNKRCGFPARALDEAMAANEATACIARIKTWDCRDKNILVMSGSKGCGKTVAAAWWALRRTQETTFVRATTFAASSRYERESRESWLKASALILDDLGAEYADANGSLLVDLDELVDVFYSDRKPLLITTNCSVQDFTARYGERIHDRLRECGSFWVTTAESLRK